MIPIQIDNKLAEEHYENIKFILLHHIERILDYGGILKQPRGRDNYIIECSDLLERDLESFISNPDVNLKPLIVQEPELLQDYIIDLHRHKFSYLNEWHDDHIILYNIFIESVYEKNGFDKSTFISKIKIDTCPYCNRNYIYTSKKKQKIKPEIDHFYPKHKYPILGISYFNLIPSCETCNGQACKHKKDPFSERILSPYTIKNEDFVISHKIKNIAIINPISGKSDVEVFFKKNPLIVQNLQTFNLENLYELHYDHAIELLIKRNLKYSKKYREYLKSYSALKFSNSEIDRIILGNYALEKEQHKRPLSKMYQDIGKELGLI